MGDLSLSLPLLLGCLAIGALLIALELFLTPGLGIKLLLGLCLIAFAVVFAFLEHGPGRGALVLALALAILGVGGWLAKLTIGRRLVLASQVTGHDAPPELQGLLGAEGVALSPLRPAGVARFGEARVDVTCESEFLEAGTAVVVTEVSGNRVRVRSRA